MQDFMLGAYWGARPDSLENCTENAVRFFARLAEIDPLLAHWFERGRSRKDALEKSVDTSDARKLHDLFLRGQNRRDVDNEVIDELGFRLSVWNGASEETAEASVSLQCGAYSERIGNNVLIDLPYQSKDLKWIENVSSLVALVAEIWQPSWAGVMSNKAMRERDFNAARPFVDWVVYVPHLVKSVPQPSRVEVQGLGSIVVVQPNPPLGDEPEELARIRLIENRLAA